MMDMKKRSTLSAVFIIVCAVLTVGTGARADGDEHLSLGYSVLSPTANDIKSPSPSSLTVKYGFGLLKDISTYVGTGVAYVLPPEVRPGENLVKMKTGVAGQAGVKIDLGAGSLLKIDYQYLHVTPDQTHGDSGPTPQSIGVGLEIKF